MIEADVPPQLDAFITWLEEVMSTRESTRAKLGHHLGPGGEQQIDKDLSRAYLPAWQYVVSTYLGPVEELTNAPLKADVLAEGRWLYDTATEVAVPYMPPAPGHESYSRVVAPVLAGFSLPAIVILATATTPVQPYRDIVLACFITATGFFLGSFQISIGWAYTRFYDWERLRGGLTLFGTILLVAAVMVLVAAVAEHWWMDLALAALGLGGLTQMLLAGWMKLPFSRWKRDHAGPPG